MTHPILSHTFANGLTLLGEPMPWLRSVAFGFLTPAGCMREPADRGGLAGFTCEMLTRGAGNRDSRQFVLDLENLGVEREESVATAHACYSGATLAENLVPALEIYADVLRRPRFAEDQLEPARLAMLLDLSAVEDEPAQKTMIELRRRHYPDPWGRPTQGNQEAVEAATLDDLRGFFARNYHAQGAILGVAGRFEWQPLLDAVGRLLGDWPGGEVPAIRETPAAGGYLHIPYESSQTQIGIAYASVPYRHPDYIQAWGAVNALSGGMSARLFTEVRERRGLCYSISASYHTLRDRGAVLVYAGTTSQRAQETLDVTLAELERLAKGIDQTELERLKARAKSALVMQQESSSGRAGSIARDWYHLGRARTLEEIGAMVDALSVESIGAYIAANPPRGYTIVTLGPSELEVNCGIS